MYYGNESRTQDPAKWLVLFLIFLFVAGGVLVAAAVGHFGPKAEAEAERIKAETGVFQAKALNDLARSNIDLETYRAKRKAEADFEPIRLEREAQQDMAVKLILTVGFSLGVVIAACGFTVRQLRLARLDAGESAALQCVQPAAGSSLRGIYQILEEMKNDLGALETRLADMEVRVDVGARQDVFAFPKQAQPGGNGHGASASNNEEEIRSTPRLTKVGKLQSKN